MDLGLINHAIESNLSLQNFQTIMAGQLKFNKAGRKYIQGRAADGDIRQLIVLNLLQNNADPITGQIPRGQQERTASKYRVGHDLVRRLCNKYVNDGDSKPKVSRNVQLWRKLWDDEVDLMEHLMYVKPSTPLQFSNQFIAAKCSASRKNFNNCRL